MEPVSPGPPELDLIIDPDNEFGEDRGIGWLMERNWREPVGCDSISFAVAFWSVGMRVGWDDEAAEEENLRFHRESISNMVFYEKGVQMKLKVETEGGRGGS
jgi:hypothetical protein